MASAMILGCWIFHSFASPHFFLWLQSHSPGRLQGQVSHWYLRVWRSHTEVISFLFQICSSLLMISPVPARGERPGCLLGLPISPILSLILPLRPLLKGPLPWALSMCRWWREGGTRSMNSGVLPCPQAFPKFLQSHARTFYRKAEYPHASL